MLEPEEDKIQKVVIHKVGNKLNEEGMYISKSEIKLDFQLNMLLSNYFLSSFKSKEYYNFYHNSDLQLNEMYVFISSIFQDPSKLYEQSVHIAEHLYEKSIHPKIKGGELYVVHFSNLFIDGVTCNAVGLFKTEQKDTFLKVYPSDDTFTIEEDMGINLNKLDKGCLIYNTEKEKGYILSIIDNTNKGNEAQYWIDDFLHVREREDEYYQTQNVMRLCKSFVTDKLPEEFEVNKAQQADILQKSVKFFKEKEDFSMQDFATEVMQEPELIKSFTDYKEQYQQDMDLTIADEFNISDTAVKKQARVFKSVIKLDKNFHIYVHGKREYITKGYDEETGMHYYQLYFKEEN